MESIKQTGGGNAAPRRRAAFLTVALVVVSLGPWTRAPSVAAAPCGGSTPCKCGDTVTANYRLDSDLGPCPGHGLVVQSKVLLDCRGFAITGAGGSIEQFGVFLNGKSGAEIIGATVKDCRISGFLRGIRLRAASGNLIGGNTANNNGNHSTHVGYGIDVSGGSHDNLFESNRVRGNADEGIHIGAGSHRNQLVGNVVADNYRENLYLLGADRNAFMRNTFGGGGVNSLYLKDSVANRFEDNTFLGKTARVIGDARDNQFVNNTFTGAGLHFIFYKGSSRYPSKNRVAGGTITDAEECLRFTSSRDNVVEDAGLVKCRTAVRSESTLGPSENTVLGNAPAPVLLDAGSTLNLGRRVSVSVKDHAGVPVAGAQVQARDAAGTSMWSATTDDTGTTPPQILLSSTLTGARAVPRTPATLTATKAGYAPASLAVPVIEGASLTISIRPE
jgi:parallel beta-helix repeat protein